MKSFYPQPVFGLFKTLIYNFLAFSFLRHLRFSMPPSEVPWLSLLLLVSSELLRDLSIGMQNSSTPKKLEKAPVRDKLPKLL